MAVQYLLSAAGAADPIYAVNGLAGPGAQQVTAGSAGAAVTPVNPGLVTSGPNEYTFTLDGSGHAVAYALNGAAASLLPANPSNSLDYLQTTISYVPFVTAAGTDDVAYFATYVASSGGLINTLGDGWFVSNGTSAGTQAAVPGGPVLLPVPQTSAVSGNRVYVAGNDGSHGTQVWSDDGATAARLDPAPASAAGSYGLVGQITPFTTAAGIAGVAFIGNTGGGGTANDQLFLSDGTAAGTRIVPTPGLAFASATPALYVSGNRLYFEATDPSGRDELWDTDGAVLARIDPAQASAVGAYAAPGNEQAFTNAAGAAALAFTAQPAGAAAGQRALYVTTGVATGASAIDLLQVTVAGMTSFQTTGYNAPPGSLVFSAIDSVGNKQLWATNGGVASRLDPNGSQATYSGGFSSTSEPFIASNGASVVAFEGNVGTAINPILQLFVSTGAGGTGTRELVVPGSSLAGGTPVASGGFAYAVGTDKAGNTQVYATDGVALTRLDPVAAADSYGSASNLTPFSTASGGAALAFTANAGTAAAPNYQLYVTDGTAAGTRAVPSGAQFTAAPGDLTVNGGNLYFTATPAGGAQLGYVYNGAGISQVAAAGAAALPVQVFDAAQTVNLAARDAIKVDGLTGTTAYTFSMTRGGVTLAPSVLTYTIAGSGTNPAGAGLFATPLRGTVSFAPGGSVAILTVNVNGAVLTADQGFTLTLGGTLGVNGVAATDIQTPVASGIIQHNTAPTPTPTPTPTPAPTPTPTPSSNPSVAAFVSANLPAGAYTGAGIALASAGLGALAGASGTVVGASSGTGSFAAPAAGAVNVAIATNPAAGSTVALPFGYGAVVATGLNAVTLSDAGAAGAVLVGNAGPTVFNSTGQGVSLVGGAGANRFNVAGSATIATGSGGSTVSLSGQAAANVFTGTGGSTVVLAGGASTVQANGQDTVFGGAGTAVVTAAKGAVAIGGAGLLTYTGGSATSVVFGGKGGLTFIGGAAFEIAVGTTGPLNARAGSGGGEFFGNAGGDFMQSGSGQTIMVLSAGGKAVSTGSAGNYLVAGAGTATLDGSAATGNDVFFGGTGQDAILCGSGSDLIGTGTGTSTVQLGSGTTTVFAFGTSTVTSGSGSASVVMGGAVRLNVAAGAARSFALFNFVPGTDKIGLSGYDGSTIGAALANQVNGSGQTVLTLSDNTQIQLIGVARADAGFFA